MEIRSFGSDDFADVAISDFLGRGRRCVAFAARKGDRNLVVKIYHQRAIARHQSQYGGSLARYEYERNAEFHRVPEFAAFSAAPIGFLSSPRAEMFLQERVFGEKLRSFLHACSAESRNKLLAELRTVLECANRAGLFDLDLHPSNIFVKQAGDGTPRPVLFDFNKVPYHLQRSNTLFEWLVNLGLTGRRSRDHRRLERFSQPTRKSIRGRLMFG